MVKISTLLVTFLQIIWTFIWPILTIKWISNFKLWMVVYSVMIQKVFILFELRPSIRKMETLMTKLFTSNICYRSYRKDGKISCRLSSCRFLEEDSFISMAQSAYLKRHFGLRILMTVPQRLQVCSIFLNPLIQLTTRFCQNRNVWHH